MNTQTTERRPATLKAGNRSLPLTKMEITGSITGLLHRTKVRQTFVNDHDVPLEAVYTHPLPPKASVHGFRLVIGNRVVNGLVQERGQARRAYSQAVSQGHRAALLEEERSDIFTTTVGNIAPGESVSISFELSGPLEFLESTASLRFPLVVPEVYISGQPLGEGEVGEGVALDTGSVPDASRITPPRLAHGAPNPVDLRLSFTVDPAGLDLVEVRSLCHFAKTNRRPDGLYEISLLPGMERMDRDFVVQLSLREKSLQTTLVHDPESGTFALTVVPPLGSGQAIHPRDLVIVLDRSGSMQGWSMTAARRAAARIVDSLTSSDRFNIIAFDDCCELFSPALVTADARQQQLALEFLSKVDSRGGTEARPAIERAISMMNRENSRDKTVLFLTDGDVGNDAELVVRSAAGIRVSTVGIGHNSRAGVLESMAQISGGLCTLIPEESTLEESLRHLHQRLGRPHWMGLSLAKTKVGASLRKSKDSDPAPRFWDVWEGVPTTFFGKAGELPEVVEVEGWLASQGKQSQKVKVLRRDDLVIHRSWARARLLDLDDLWTIGKAEPADLVKVSVEAQVLCRFTAFVAIDEVEMVENTEALRTIVQPVEPTLKVDLQASSGFRPGRSAPAPMASRCEAAPMEPLDFEAPSKYDDFDCCDEFVDESWVDEESFEDDSSPRSIAFGPLSPPSLSDAMKTVRRGFNAASDLLKRKSKPEKAEKAEDGNFWSVLLQKLEELSQLAGKEREERLARLVTLVGGYHRQLSSGSPQALVSQQVMSLLVDLEKAFERGEDGEVSLTALRAVVGAAQHLPG